MILIQDGMQTLLTNRPFAGGLGVKVYAGLGSPDAIRYRPNQIFDAINPPINPDFANDVSVASALSAADDLTFSMPDAWVGRDDIWLQVRTFEADYENETIGGPQLLVVNDDGDSLGVLEGTARILRVTPKSSGQAEVQFTWTPDKQCVRLSGFAFVRTAGPTSPADKIFSVQNRRIQIDLLTGLSEGTYTFRLEARADTRALVLGTVDVVIPPAPESTITLTFEEA